MGLVRRRAVSVLEVDDNPHADGIVRWPGLLWLLRRWVSVDARPARRRPRRRASASHASCRSSRTLKTASACHNNLTSPAGEDISIGVAWRATMMANSARDPYWQAGVRRETLDHPEHAADIQDECGGCHMPMAQQIARARRRQGRGVRAPAVRRRERRPMQRLAADGVSCTVCHQIAADGLGTPERFNGRFAVTPPWTAASGASTVPSTSTPDATRSCVRSPATSRCEAPHIRESELCASCHTLITTALGQDGEVIGSLPEQMNFQEWQHSAFATERKQLPVVPHAAYRGPGARRLRAGRLPRRAVAACLRRWQRPHAALVQPLPRRAWCRGRTAGARSDGPATIRQLQQDTATLSIAEPAR